MAKKILIVDDDLESVKLIGLMMERRGYKIAAAQSGAQALNRIQEEDPDLVILDVMMPDMDGYEVCRRLRTNPATVTLPIIMFTAKTQVDDKVAGFQAGADDYLTKPVHPEELASRVEAVLLRSAGRQVEVQAAVSSRAKIVGFVGSKGGVGTTTLAVNVAVALARGPARDKRVVLADLQSGMSAVSFQLGLRELAGIARLLKEPVERIDTQLVEAQLEQHRSGLMVLSGQIEPSGVALPVPLRYAKTLTQYLGSVSDYLLLDLGVGLGEVNAALLPGCHWIVVAIEPQRVSLMLAQALLAEMSGSLKIPHHKVVLVLVNKAPSATTLNKETIEGLLQHDLVGIVTPAPELAFQSAEQGVPMVTAQPTSLVAQQIQKFANYLVET